MVKHYWRFQIDHRSGRRETLCGDQLPSTSVDEVVIADWLHVEHMGGNRWFAQIGDRAFWLSKKRGKMVITMEEQRTAPEKLKA